MDWIGTLGGAFVVIEYLLKILAIGIVPEGRNPGSSAAWLLAIFFIPVIGLPLYLVIGSPWVRGRRQQKQQEVQTLIAEHTRELPTVPEGVDVDLHLASIVTMNRALTGLPCVTGTTEGAFGNTPEAYAAMAAAISSAKNYVHFEFYITSWDSVSDPVFRELFAAHERGVKVRILFDHLGSRKYPGFQELQQKLTSAGIAWSLMMPIDPFKGKWRRPDLRNHRKLLVIDGERGFIGSHNMIAPAYGSAKNEAIGRHWKDLSLQFSGPAVVGLAAVFATDWYSETGERLGPSASTAPRSGGPLTLGGSTNAMQVVCSGPGFPTEPNLRMFVALVQMANSHITITSPYFVPDDALLDAITSAAYRGVRVDLFVGEKADQFVVGHAQRSYYRPLLEAGVRIHLYPAPMVLHAKYLTIDGKYCAIGSSNMDYRSYALNYEIMMLGFGGDMVDLLRASDEEYLSVSRELTSDEWRKQPFVQRYFDNVCRLASTLM